MTVDDIYGIVSRWFHVFTAAVVIGAVFFVRVVLPMGLRKLDDPEKRQEVLASCRRGLKMIVHTAILVLVVSGTYNAMRNWKVYHDGIPLTHALFGTHILLALIVFGISLAALAGKTPKASGPKLMAVNLLLLVLVVASASTLKWAREKAMKKSTASPAPVKVESPATMPSI